MFNLAETENARIINLTQHPFSQDQLNEFTLAGITADNIIDTNDTLKAIITFTGEIDVAVIQEKANQLSQYIAQYVGDNPSFAMVGGAPFFPNGGKRGLLKSQCVTFSSIQRACERGKRSS